MRGTKQIRTVVAAFAELSLAPRPWYLLSYKRFLNRCENRIFLLSVLWLIQIGTGEQGTK